MFANSTMPTMKMGLKRCAPWWAAAAMALTAVHAPAQSGPTAAPDEAAASSAQLPPEKQNGPVTYLSGGVPDAQWQAFQRARRDYPLAIELYQKAGAKNEFTSGAQVKLTNQAGNVVLDDRADGPIMLVRVPPGRYKVEATLNNKKVELKSVAVAGAGSKRAVVVFPQGTD